MVLAAMGRSLKAVRSSDVSAVIRPMSHVVMVHLRMLVRGMLLRHTMCRCERHAGRRHQH